MRVLYLSPRQAWPANSGAKLRDFHLARALSRTAELRYLFFGSAEAETALAEQLGSARAIAPPRKYTAGKIAKGLFTEAPLPLINYFSESMAAGVEAELRASAFDLVHLDSIHMASYVPMVRKLRPEARITLDWHNIESEAMGRFAAGSSSRLKSFYARYTSRKLEGAEDALLGDLDGQLVCSERERAVLLQRSPHTRVAVIENGVDCRYFQPSSAPVESRLVFVGQMSYGPNAEGAIWFVQRIWPALRQAFADLTVDIVGADPSPAVRALGNEPGVNVTGTVPDVRSYYCGALAAIVPLLSGAGTRLKILEAMAAGVPVLSTAIGAEGLAVEAGTHYLQVGGDPEGWGAALQRASHARASFISEARRLVETQYDWEAIGRKLADTYESWVRR